ncbi:MAG: DNA-protecting protein DprA, partial [Neisseriaceae bacterium]|nr:DNA-protecting protein DprA [Neisseriaceae bacterium]
LKQGATLVENVADILAELPLYIQPSPPSTNPSPTQAALPLLSTQAQACLDAMGFDPIHPDGLTQKLGIPAADVYAQLLQLELSGIVHPLAGGRFQRLS